MPRGLKIAVLAACFLVALTPPGEPFTTFQVSKSIVVVGDALLLEDGSGCLLLEDGSGCLLLQ